MFWNIKKKVFQIALKCPFSNLVKWRPSMGRFDGLIGFGPEANWVWRCRRWLQVTKLVSTEFSPKKCSWQSWKKETPLFVGFTKKRVGSLHVHIHFCPRTWTKRDCLVWRWGDVKIVLIFLTEQVSRKTLIFPCYAKSGRRWDVDVWFKAIQVKTSRRVGRTGNWWR